LDDASKHVVEDQLSTRAVPSAVAEKLTSAATRFATAFDDIGMGDIASASGIPRATLYYYFAGKDDVLAFLLRSMFDDMRVSVATALDATGDTRTRLEAVVRAQLGHLAANPAASQLLVMNLGRAGRLGAIASGIDAGFHAPVRQILAEGAATGEVADIDIETAATAIYGAVTIVGLQALVISGDLDVDATAARLFPLFWSGLEPPRSKPRKGKR
jgi:AcrR family transcriptional regulator